jgi:hypothetical protein
MTLAIAHPAVMLNLFQHPPGGKRDCAISSDDVVEHLAIHVLGMVDAETSSA